jgi:hypothetical protein
MVLHRGCSQNQLRLDGLEGESLEVGRGGGGITLVEGEVNRGRGEVVVHRLESRDGVSACLFLSHY